MPRHGFEAFDLGGELDGGGLRARRPTGAAVSARIFDDRGVGEALNIGRLGGLRVSSARKDILGAGPALAALMRAALRAATSLARASTSGFGLSADFASRPLQRGVIVAASRSASAASRGATSATCALSFEIEAVRAASVEVDFGAGVNSLLQFVARG